MFPSLAYRTLRTVSPRLLWKLGWNFCFKNLIAAEKFKSRLRRDEHFPAFLHLSIINSCNLHCTGCWVDVDAPQEKIDLDLLNRVVNEAKKEGVRFFGLLGGEPFLHPQFLDMLAAHPDCYFQAFTNGQLITEKVAAEMNRLGIVTPLISIEGKEIVSDERRGGKDVYRRTMRGLENCIRAKLLTGVATSLCRTNIDELLTEKWLRDLIGLGVHYVWYYAYRPAGSMMSTDLALRPDQLLRARKFIVEMRSKVPIVIVDAYYDHEGRSLCPSATGMSHHISPRGEIEPCPVIQLAKENIRDAGSISSVIRNSAFLRDYRETAAQATRGCIILERPDLLKALALRHGARDTTSRQTFLKELDSMCPCFSQWLPGQEIPERHWMYRWAKKFWFNDFGIYRQTRHDAEGKIRALKTSLQSTPPLDDSKKVAKT
jgi:MoaA/NifB/PqqE/SkfB family radical SAM enzyme